MYNVNILYHNEHGCVAQCNRCKSLKLAFGTTTIVLSDVQFYEFKSVIRDYYVANSWSICRHTRRIEIATSVKSIHLLYSLEELEELCELLNKTELALKMENLLKVSVSNIQTEEENENKVS